MFNWKNQPQSRQQPEPQQPHFPSETERTAQFQALVEIIRTEIRVGVDPLRSDVQNLKLAIEDVRRTQDRMYNREVVDLKFADRDNQLRALREDHEELVKTHSALDAKVGGQTKQFFITASIVLSPIAILVALLGQVFHVFPH